MKPPEYNPEWPNDVKAVYAHDMQEMWDPSINRHIWNMYHSQLDLYCSLVDKKKSLRILDVGCAQATLALTLAEDGHRVWAMDIRQQFLDYAAARYEKGEIDFVCGNVMEMTLDKKFDLIFANQLIEHLVYPLDLVNRLKSLLHPGGRLVMTTPNAEYIKSDLPSLSQLGDVGQYEHRQFSADGDGHFFAYTANELIGIFKKAGFEEIAIRFFESPWISGHMKFRYLHGFLPPQVLRILDRLILSVPVVMEKFSFQLLIVGTT